MGKENRLQLDNLLTEFGDSGIEIFVLGAKHFNLGLQVVKPLLLALATLESRDTRTKVNRCPIEQELSGLGLPITFQKVLPLLFVG